MSKKQNFTKLEKYVKSKVSSSRFSHCVSVGNTAMFFNQKFKSGFSDEECYEAGLLHDIAKNWQFEDMLIYCKNNNIRMEKEEIENPVLLHAPVGSGLVREMGYSEDCQLAVRWHTLGSVDMGRLGLIIYLSDYLEPLRPYLSDEDRMAFNKLDSLEDICIKVIDNEIKHRKSNNQTLANTTEALYNYIKDGGTF